MRITEKIWLVVLVISFVVGIGCSIIWVDSFSFIEEEKRQWAYDLSRIGLYTTLICIFILMIYLTVLQIKK